MYKQVYLSIGNFKDYVRFNQVKQQNFYVSNSIRLTSINKDIILLRSWDTIVACIDTNENVLYHFGKGYSRTTSKQLTMFINENKGSLFDNVIYLGKYYNWVKFKASYLRG